MRRAERGITLLGAVIVFIVLGFFAYIGMRVIPMYVEYRAVVAAVDAVAGNPGLINRTPQEIWNLLDKRLYTSYVTSVRPEHMRIERKPSPRLVVAYEVEAPFFDKIKLVGKFEHSAAIN